MDDDDFFPSPESLLQAQQQTPLDAAVKAIKRHLRTELAAKKNVLPFTCQAPLHSTRAAVEETVRRLVAEGHAARFMCGLTVDPAGAYLYFIHLDVPPKKVPPSPAVHTVSTEAWLASWRASTYILYAATNECERYLGSRIAKYMEKCHLVAMERFAVEFVGLTDQIINLHRLSPPDDNPGPPHRYHGRFTCAVNVLEQLDVMAKLTYEENTLVRLFGSIMNGDPTREKQRFAGFLRTEYRMKAVRNGFVEFLDALPAQILREIEREAQRYVPPTPRRRQTFILYLPTSNYEHYLGTRIVKYTEDCQLVGRETFAADPDVDPEDFCIDLHYIIERNRIAWTMRPAPARLTTPCQYHPFESKTVVDVLERLAVVKKLTDEETLLVDMCIAILSGYSSSVQKTCAQQIQRAYDNHTKDRLLGDFTTFLDGMQPQEVIQLFDNALQAEEPPSKVVKPPIRILYEKGNSLQQYIATRAAIHHVDCYYHTHDAVHARPLQSDSYFIDLHAIIQQTLPPTKRAALDDSMGTPPSNCRPYPYAFAHPLDVLRGLGISEHLTDGESLWVQVCCAFLCGTQTADQECLMDALVRKYSQRVNRDHDFVTFMDFERVHTHLDEIWAEARKVTKKPATPVTEAPPMAPPVPETWECSICLDNRKDTAFNCGHVCTCQTCSTRVQICPLCRVAVTTRQKIYL